MAVVCLKESLDLDRLLQRSMSLDVQPTTARNAKLGCVLHLWRVRKGEASVEFEAISLSPLPQLSEDHAYIVLHTYGPVLCPQDTAQSYNALAQLVVDAVACCAARGLSSRFADTRSFDLYQWNGNKARADVKSLALGKTFQLNTSLGAIASRLDCPLHDFLIQNAAVLPLASDNVPPITTFPLIARNSHVFARCTSVLFGGDEPTPRAPGSQAAAPAASGVRPVSKSYSSFARANRASKPSPAALASIPSSSSSSPSASAKRAAAGSVGGKGKGEFPAPRVAAKAVSPKAAAIGSVQAKRGSTASNKARPLSLPKDKGPLALKPERASLSLDINQVLGGLDDGALEPDEHERKLRKLNHFNRICSQITPQLFLGSNTVAADEQLLAANGVTHVLNTARGMCENHFEKDGKLVYRSYFLADGPHEDITCVLFDAVKYITDAVADPNNRVFVHCFQGVSRSASMVIAFLMVSRSLTYEQAYKYVRLKRGIVEPNTGFMVQLREFAKRLEAGAEKPRLFEIQSHKQEAPKFLVPRQVADPSRGGAHMYDHVQSMSLHPDTAFVLHTPDQQLYLWIGKHAQTKHIARAREYAQWLVEREHAKEPVEVKQGVESAAFWGVFEDNGSGFKRGDQTERCIEKADIVEERPGLEVTTVGDVHMYAWPDGDEIEMFDSDDLLDDGAFLLHDKSGEVSAKAYFWVGSSCELADAGSSAAVQAEALIDKLALSGHAGICVVGEDESEESPFWDMFVHG